ncbi:hypothetical protein DFJ58DRAFT_163095 [Suillus subalutaceus]|uniref:uncharacterized protein n=1 Tax=Suillus subalutaceus TaxID=48586 RepID=UPI001B87A3C1|nr:uncharacterized protein DFJ58DRAFT_163095 [Suillus subalutaceus]KAG1836753.1 hypothetical protein DFJ58DRAFT_163095 [Suillus subalutaceus]
MTPSTDRLAKYTHEKLMPFPGIKKLQEQWNHRQPLFSSTPDIILSHHVEADIPLPSSSSSNTPSNSPEINGDRKLSHQASDTHLLHIYKAQAPPLSASASTSSHDHYQHDSPHSPSSIMLKSLPTNRDGVRRWLNARKLFPQPSQSPVGNSPPMPSPEQKPAVASKKPSLSDLLRLRKKNDSSAELHDERVDADRANTESIDPQVRVETPSRREGSTWSNIVHTLPRSASSKGRRSRTNSIVTSRRRQHTDSTHSSSSSSRESGASHSSLNM